MANALPSFGSQDLPALPDEASKGVLGSELLAGSQLQDLKALGPYVFVRVLAKGGMGAVFEVRHRDLGASYALKTVLAAPATPSFELQHARFRREAELNARLEHPGILRVHSAALDESPPYLVVDLLRGGSLGERLESVGPLSVEEGISLALALARALRHAHQAGVLHRDLKPENVMFDEFGEARLVDFGLALEVGRESRLTQSGTAVGTPLTMAPEQIRGERQETSATDVYGLAATIYWALSGEAPLGADFVGLPDLIGAILSRRVRPLREVRPEVPRALSNLLSLSLGKDPDGRPGLERWIEVLERLQTRSASRSALGRLSAGASPEQRQALLFLSAGLTLTLVAGATFALWLAGGWGGGWGAGGAPLRAPRVAGSLSPQGEESEVKWQAAFRAGKRAEARRGFLRDSAPLSKEDATSAAVILAEGGLTPTPIGDLEDFAARLEGLEGEEAGTLWVLGCIRSGDLGRGRQLARRETLARELLELEALRARLDAKQVLPRLSALTLGSKLGEAKEAFSVLEGRAKAWRLGRLSTLAPAERTLAGLVLERLQWTLGRLSLVLIQSNRVHGSGSGIVQRVIRLRRELPESPSLGRTTLDLFLANEQTSGNYPKHYALLARAKRHEQELLSDPGGAVLYGSLAVRYEPDPGKALRLGLEVRRRTKSLGDLSRQAHWVSPRALCRYLELKWLGKARKTDEIRDLIAFCCRGGVPTHRDLYPAVLARLLSARDLQQVEVVLAGGESSEQVSDLDNSEALWLIRSELELALDPVGAARRVLERHTPLRGYYLEELGLRVHASALAGLDPAPDLAAFERKREQGWRRLGLPWHAFKLQDVLKGKAWWPGVPR